MKKTITINGQKTKVDYTSRQSNKVKVDETSVIDLILTVDGKEHKDLYQCIASTNKKTGNHSQYFISIKTGEKFVSEKKILEHLLS